MDAPPDHGRQEATGCSIVGSEGAGRGLEIAREAVTGVEHDRDSPENRQAASTLAHNFLSYWTMPRTGRRGIPRTSPRGRCRARAGKRAAGPRQTVHAGMGEPARMRVSLR